MNLKDFCQSCAMPLAGAEMGTNKDGSKNDHYCSYCYKDGAFQGDMTMDEMIALCAPHTAQATNITEEEAVSQMKQYFPMLERWAAK